jgi:hypothetical protein
MGVRESAREGQGDMETGRDRSTLGRVSVPPCLAAAATLAGGALSDPTAGAGPLARIRHPHETKRPGLAPRRLQWSVEQPCRRENPALSVLRG